MNKQLSIRLIACLCVCALVFSLLPLYALAMYNHPFYDDFGFSVRIHHVWTDTGSVAEAVREAWRNMLSTRQTWQGNYTATFLSGIQPGVFDEDLYFLTTCILLTSLIAGCAALIAAALRRLLNADWAAVALIASLLLFLIVQMTPAVDEAYFWFNGGIGYTFNYALLALAGSLGIRLWRCGTKRRAALHVAVLAALLVLLGGGSYTSGLFALVGFGFVGLLAFCRKSRWRWCYVGLVLLYAACLVYSMTAPGNLVRAETLSGGLSAPMAIAQSFYFGLALMGDWLSVPLCVVCAVCAFVLIPSLRESRYAFRYPVVVTLLCVCIFCTQLTPTLFTGNYLGDGRTVNTYFYSYVLMAAFLSVYWAGWALKRLGALAGAMEGGRGGIRLGAALAAALLLMGRLIGYRPYGGEEVGLTQLAGGSALRSLLNGEAAAYDAAMDARDAAMNDPENTRPVLTPVENVPDAFMGDALNADNLDYVLSLYAEYYEKQQVTAAEGE